MNKITIIVDIDELVDQIENVIIIDDEGNETWKDMVDLEFLKKHIKPIKVKNKNNARSKKGL